MGVDWLYHAKDRIVPCYGFRQIMQFGAELQLPHNTPLCIGDIVQYVDVPTKP